MTQNTTPIDSYRQIYHRLSKSPQHSPAHFTISQVTKKSLEENPTFLYLRQKLNVYSKKVSKEIQVDEYETRIYEKLFQFLSDLNNIKDKNLQVTHIQQIKIWLQEQERILKSRVKQGKERIMVTNDSRKIIQLFNNIHKEKQQFQSRPKKAKSQLQEYNESFIPYLKKWRTIHNDTDVPSVRLNHYQRKLLCTNIKSPIQSPQKYSMLNNKIKYLSNYHVPFQKLTDDEKQILTQNQSIAVGENDIPEQMIQLDDIPMFGQEVEEADEQKQESNQNDDLVPKVRLYLSETKIPNNKANLNSNNIKFQSQVQQKRLNFKLKLKRNKEIIQKHQDEQMILLSQKRAKQKASITRQQHKKSQISKGKFQYSIMKQPQTNQFNLSVELQNKYHLKKAKSERKQSQLELSLHLPKLNTSKKENSLQKTLNKPSLDILKKRFSSILNLSPPKISQTEHEQQQPSIVQYSARAYPSISQKYNKKFCRQEGLEQAQSIRQKFNNKKLSINMQTLLNGLCIPNQQQRQLLELPQKGLLRNVLMVESKKKKKEK